jgi:hypothetical protein
MMPGQVGSSSSPTGGHEPTMSATELAERKFSALMAALLAGTVAPAMTPVEPDLPVLLPETPPTKPAPSPVDSSEIVEDQVPIEPDTVIGCGSPVECAVSGVSSEETGDASAPAPVACEPDDDQISAQEASIGLPASVGDLPALFHSAYAAMARIRTTSAPDGPASGVTGRPSAESGLPDGAAPSTNPTSDRRGLLPTEARPDAEKIAQSREPHPESQGGIALDGLESLVEDLELGSSPTAKPLTATPKLEPQATIAQDAVPTPPREQPALETVAPKAVTEAVNRLLAESERPEGKPHSRTTSAPAEPSLYATAMPATTDGGSLPEPVEVRPAPMAQETSRPPTATDRVTLHLPDEAGGTRIQIAVRGETVHTRIVASNPAAAGNLEHGVGDLRDALARQGFQEQQVRVETRPPVTEPRSAVEAGWAPAAARDSAGASNERRQESDPREDARRPDPREQQQHRSPNRDRRGRER